MEDQILLPIFRNSKNEVSKRVKKYTKVYSERPSSAREVLKKQPKKELESTQTNQKHIFDISRLSFRAESIKTLEKTAKNLLYEVQKATSDRFELIRDLSTYDCEFSRAVSLKSKLETFILECNPLPQVVQMINLNKSQENSCFKHMKSNLCSISALDPGGNSDFDPSSEDFSIRKPRSGHVLKPVYQSVCFISGEYTILSLSSDQWLENLHFKAVVFDTQLSLKLKQRISNNCYTKAQIFAEIKEKLLPHLTIQCEKQQIRLELDKKQRKEYYCFLIRVKGYQLCNVVASPKSETQLFVELPELEQSLYIDQTCDLTNLQSLKSLTRLLKANLFYNKSKKTLIYTNPDNFFTASEKSSKFLNDDFIKSSTLPMGNFTQLYTFDLPSYKIDCYTDHSKIILKLSKHSYSEEFQRDSKNVSFLEAFQDIDISKSPVTLSKSLELTFLLNKLFP